MLFPSVHWSTGGTVGKLSWNAPFSRYIARNIIDPTCNLPSNEIDVYAIARIVVLVAVVSKTEGRAQVIPVGVAHPDRHARIIPGGSSRRGIRPANAYRRDPGRQGLWPPEGVCPVSGGQQHL